MFSRPKIKSLLQQFTLVQLYTDTVPPHFQRYGTAAENRRLLQEKFGTAQLPLYVILEPLSEGTYKEVSRYAEGKINNVDGFAQFLQDGLAKNGAPGRTQAKAN